MGIWHATRKPILLVRLSPKGVNQHGVGQGDAHRTHGCGKSMPLSCWELLGTKREPAWRLPRRDCQEWQHRVIEATHPRAYPPHLVIDRLNKSFTRKSLYWNNLLPLIPLQVQFVTFEWDLFSWRLLTDFKLICWFLEYPDILLSFIIHWVLDQTYLSSYVFCDH